MVLVSAQNQTAVGPLNVTTSVGGSAVFNCSGLSGPMYWVYYGPSRQSLYYSSPPQVINSRKYQVIQVNETFSSNQTSYTLTVLNVGLMDAGTYSCQRSGLLTELLASLVVFGEYMNRAFMSCSLCQLSNVYILLIHTLVCFYLNINSFIVPIGPTMEINVFIYKRFYLNINVLMCLLWN